ncbi:hypothetical protein GQ600_27750 [Phytophthora cactorum]|nr:hypothetical protein GQ600_27750 [Phytophthora cactorum]
MSRESKRSRLLREYAVLLDRRLQVRKARLALGVKDECDDEWTISYWRVSKRSCERAIFPRAFISSVVPRFSWLMTKCRIASFFGHFEWNVTRLRNW